METPPNAGSLNPVGLEPVPTETPPEAGAAAPDFPSVSFPGSQPAGLPAPGAFDEIPQTFPTSPMVEVAAIDPPEPLFEDGEVSIQLKGGASAENLRFEYRTSEAGEWNPATGEQIVFRRLAAGALSVELRAVDSQGTAFPSVTRTWFVQSNPWAGWSEMRSIDVMVADVHVGQAVFGGLGGVSEGGLTVVTPSRAVRSYSLYDGTLVQKWTTGHAGRPVAYSPFNSRLACGDKSGVVRLWTVGAKKNAKLIGHRGPLHALRFSADGAYLASAGSDGLVRLWRMDDASEWRQLQGHVGEVLATTFSPDGALLASAGDDSTIRLWQCRDGVLLRTIETVRAPAESLLLMAVASAAAQPTGVAGDGSQYSDSIGGIPGAGAVPQAAPEPQSPQGPGQGPSQGSPFGPPSSGGIPPPSTIGPGGDQGSVDISTLAVVAGCRDGVLRIWRVTDGALLREIAAHKTSVRALASSGYVLASGDSEGGIKLWCADNGALLKKLEGHSKEIVCLGFDAANSHLYSGGRDNSVRAWGIAADGLGIVPRARTKRPGRQRFGN